MATRREFLKAGLGLAVALLANPVPQRSNPTRKALRFLQTEAQYRLAQVFPTGTPEPVQHKVLPTEIPDVQALKTGELEEHVKFAYQAKDRFPWAKELNEEDFFHYVLPYRNGTMPLEQFQSLNWRRAFLTQDGWAQLQTRYGVKTTWQEFDTRLKQLSQRYATNPQETLKQVVQYINTELWHQKEGIAYERSNAQEKTLEQIMTDKGGRCTDLTHFAVMALRSIGVPATIARVPAWARYDDNHQVLAIKGPNEWILADALRPAPAVDDDYWYHFGPAPKIYVEQFGNWSQFADIRDSRKDHPWFIDFYLGTRSCVDMTSQFIPTTSIIVQNLTPGKTTYLGVLNNFCSDGVAKIARAHVDTQGIARFDNIGRNASAVYFSDNAAFIAHQNGQVEPMTRPGPQANYDIADQIPEGKTLELHVWTNGNFTKLGEVSARSSRQELNADTVYILKDAQEPVWSYKRPFVPRADGSLDKY